MKKPRFIYPLLLAILCMLLLPCCKQAPQGISLSGGKICNQPPQGQQQCFQIGKENAYLITKTSQGHILRELPMHELVYPKNTGGQHDKSKAGSLLYGLLSKYADTLQLDPQNTTMDWQGDGISLAINGGPASLRSIGPAEAILVVPGAETGKPIAVMVTRSTCAAEVGIQDRINTHCAAADTVCTLYFSKPTCALDLGEPNGCGLVVFDGIVIDYLDPAIIDDFLSPIRMGLIADMLETEISVLQEEELHSMKFKIRASSGPALTPGAEVSESDRTTILGFPTAGWTLVCEFNSKGTAWFGCGDRLILRGEDRRILYWHDIGVCPMKFERSPDGKTRIFCREDCCILPLGSACSW